MCRVSVNNMKRLKLTFAHPTLVRHNKNVDPIPAKSFAKWQVPAFHPCWNGAWLSSWVNGFNPSNHLNPWQEFQPTLSGIFSSHVVFEGDDPNLTEWNGQKKLSTIINLCILLSTSSRLVLVAYTMEHAVPIFFCVAGGRGFQSSPDHRRTKKDSGQESLIAPDKRYDL